jgi:signal recognition particle subunit SRP72
VAATNLAALVGARDKRGAECFRRAEKLCDGAGVLRAELSALGVNETTRRAVINNRAVALVHGNRLVQARDMLPVVKTQCGAFAAAALAAAVATRERKPNEARDALLSALASARAARDKNTSRDVLLTQAQLFASSGEYAECAKALREAMADDETGDGFFGGAPAATATLAAVLDLAGDADAADAALDAMLAGSAAGGKTDGARKTSLVPPAATLRAADRALARGHAAEAAAAYAAVADGTGAVAVDDETRGAALAGAARAAVSLGDLDAAERFASAASELTPVAGASRALDADALEEALPASVVARAAELEKKMAAKSSKRGAGDFGSSGQAGVNEPKKRARKKKTIAYPKGFDPKNPGPPPDPERWLPLRERASFKGKRKKQVTVRGAQGAANMSVEERKKEFSGDKDAGEDKSAEKSVAEKIAAARGTGKKGKKGRR